MSRIRMPLLFVGTGGVLLLSIGQYSADVRYAVIAVFSSGFLLQWFVRPPRRASVNVASPVEGRWQIYNSPSSKVPSHGIHGWAQTFAVDFVFDPATGERPAYAEGRAINPPGEYPGFGRSIFSPIDGEVVAVSDCWRDHGSRNSTLGRLLMMLESVRELCGPSLLIGNRVILRHPDGWHVLLAHLKRGSVTVKAGDPVKVGQAIAACGNSGNSSEPHLHLQVMDTSNIWIAIPLPFTINGESLPPSGQWLDAGSHRPVSITPL